MTEQAKPIALGSELGMDRERRGVRASRGTGAAVNLSQPERIVSALAGGFLAVYGVRRKGWSGLGLAAVGAELVRRGMSGHCMAYQALGVSTEEGHLKIVPRESAEVHPEQAVNARATVTIGRPRAELYRMWRDFSRLPSFMDYLERVDVLSPTRSHWVTKGPAGTHLEWDAEIVEERENEYIEWRSVHPAEIPNRGTVQFVDASDGKGTEVFVTLDAEPPAGKVGDLVARVFGTSPQRQVTSALHRFKQIAETGEVLTTEGQSSGRMKMKDAEHVAEQQRARVGMGTGSLATPGATLPDARP